MLHKTSIRPFLITLPLLALIGCGSDDGGAVDPPLLRGTLAYVVTECRVEPEVVTNHAELRVRKGDGEPVTVAEYEAVVDPDAPHTIPGLTNEEACELFGLNRQGTYSVPAHPFQLVAVSPDGSRVAWELTEQFLAGDPPPDQLPPEAEGIFVVRADALHEPPRRLGPASSVASFSLGHLVGPVRFVETAGFRFSPNGRLLVFVDKGPGPAGEDALQVWTQDVVSGRRTQITRLPNGPPYIELGLLFPNVPRTCCARFLDSETIEFGTTVRLDDLNQPPIELPESRARAAFTVKTNGEELREITRIPVPDEAPQIEESFIITGERPSVGTINFAEGGFDKITCRQTLSQIPGVDNPGNHRELFYFDGDLLLQLTDFRIKRTGTRGGHTLSTDGSTAFFVSAATSRRPSPPVGWTIIDEGDQFGPSEWLVVAGKLRQLSDIFGNADRFRTDPVKPGTFAVADGTLGLSDYTLAVTLESNDDDALGVMFRYQDPNNYYRISFDRQGAYRRLTKKVAGTVTILAEDDVRYEENTAYATSVTVAGDRLQVFQDGALIFDVTDAELATGGIALYTWASFGADFDDALVTEPGGSVLFSDGFDGDDGVVETNPSGNCQLFSIDVTGSNLRQLTHFDEVEHSTSGCEILSTPDCGCTLAWPYQDPWTEALVFYSSCDPFGRNPYGGEIFAIRPDGTELRQLTETRGFVDNRDSDGSFVVELPGPYAYSSKHPGGYR